MKKLLLFLLIVCAHTVSGQDVKTEIDKQVWAVFTDAFNKFDTDRFMSVYSKNVVRVPVDEKKILNYNEYRKSINREYQFNKNYNIKANIELRFTERIHSADKAYEKGIFRIKLIDNNAKPATIYNKFQVVLNKESGTWKIVFDSDSSEGSTLSEKDFQAAQPL